MSFITETTLFFDSKQGSGSSQNFTVHYTPPIQLDQTKRYAIGLVSADLWYSWYNVNTENNRLKYYNGTIWKYIKLQPGVYNITDINTEFKRLIDSDGDQSVNILIAPNYSTLKCRIILSGNYQIDFTQHNSINTVLGFESRILAQDGTYDGLYNVNITDINSLLIRCSVINDSYINGSSSDCIFNFSPNVPPGSLIQVRPFAILYLAINTSYNISEITMRITDQSDKEVNLNDERVTYFLLIKQIL